MELEISNTFGTFAKNLAELVTKCDFIVTFIHEAKMLFSLKLIFYYIFFAAAAPSRV